MDSGTTGIESLYDQHYPSRDLPRDHAVAFWKAPPCSEAALPYARIAADRRRAGRPISGFDAQIAAIARSVGAVIATRNAADFADCGVEVVNPWGS